MPPYGPIKRNDLIHHAPYLKQLGFRRDHTPVAYTNS